MSEMFEPKPGELSGGGDPRESDEPLRTRVARAVNRAKTEVRNHPVTALSTSIALSLLAGFLISRRRHAQQRREWAEMILKQLNQWLNEGGTRVTVPIHEAMDFVLAAAKDISNKGAEYSRRITPFRRHTHRRVPSIF
jgi:hypothetical protein